jgi:transposase
MFFRKVFFTFGTVENTAGNTVTISTEEYKKFQKLEQEYLYLKHELEQLKRMIFGSKSERFVCQDKDQLSLFSEEEKTPAPQQETITYQRKKDDKKKKGHPRPKISANLPRKEEVIEPGEVTENMRKIGEEVTEVLEYEPGNLFVRKVTRPKYVTKNEDQGVIIANLPSLPLPRSNAGAGLLAQIMVSKFIDHLPFYRQIQQFKRQGVTIADSTINGWFGNTCKLLWPLYEKLKTIVSSKDYLMADETPIPVQDSHKQGVTHTGYHWVYFSPVDKLVCFDYRPGRDRAGPKTFLEGFCGTLQTDGYNAYDQFNDNKNIIQLACMAHARRYFEKALGNDNERAEHILLKIQELYKIEKSARKKNLSYQERYALRKEKAVPILEEIKTWLDDNLTKVLPKSAIGKAILYMLKFWDRLKGYVDDGRYEIDNNLVENSIRPVALGRKNYMFAGSHQAASHAAMMYSFFDSCKRNEINPFEWLKTILEKIPEHKANELEELLPHKYNKKK